MQSKKGGLTQGPQPEEGTKVHTRITLHTKHADYAPQPLGFSCCDYGGQRGTLDWLHRHMPYHPFCQL